MQKDHLKVTAIIGTYRKGGVIDSAVDFILSAAREEGAETSKIYLVDRHIEFCTNCRICTQAEGRERGACPVADEMGTILDQIEQSDALILASPMNFGTVTAVMKRFIERLVCYAYWPWGKPAPKMRLGQVSKRVVIVASSAAPSLMARFMTGLIGLMKNVSRLLGARPVGVLFIGLAARRRYQGMGWLARRKARRLGKKLVRSE